MAKVCPNCGKRSNDIEHTYIYDEDDSSVHAGENYPSNVIELCEDCRRNKEEGTLSKYRLKKVKRGFL